MLRMQRRAGVATSVRGSSGELRRGGLATLKRGARMSTDPFKAGGKVELEAMAAENAKLIDAALAEEREAEQADMFRDDPITVEEAAEAHDELGDLAGPLTVLRHVREKRKQGRPRGAKNRANRDLQAYLLQFGPDPAVTMMKIQGESEEAMIARSRQLDPPKKQMTFAEARAIRIRCAEGVRKIFHGDQPVQVDHTIQGVRVVEQIGAVREREDKLIEGVAKVLPPREIEGGDDA